jgi:hypothetical protein
VESMVCRGGVVSLTKNGGHAFPRSEGTGDRNDSGQCGQAGGAGAHELTDICSRPRRRALSFVLLVREPRTNAQRHWHLCSPWATVRERRLSGASGVTERPNVIYTST